MPKVNRSGENNGNAKLTTEQVVGIKKAIAQQMPRRDIQKSFNISESMYWGIKRNKYWKHVDVE